MNSFFRSKPRRVRVVARPKDRARRARAFAALAALAVLGFVAVSVVKHVAGGFSAERLAALARPGVVTVEAPEPLRGPAQAVADRAEGGPADKAAAIRARFACVADIRIRRDWAEKTARLVLSVREPVARATRGGRPAGWLDREGLVFDAPEGLFAVEGPSVEAGGADAAELARLAREWPALSAPGAFPAPLARMARRADGWEAALADGTSVLWGRLDHTGEKLGRLAEAIADARRREDGAYSADLRWFEDGKVLLKHAPALAARAGATR